MERKYIITCQTNPYQASRTAKWKGSEILKWDTGSPTPIKWVHDDRCGCLLTITEARDLLMEYAREDWEANGGKIRHKYFSMYYDSDGYMYRIEKRSLY